MTDGKRLKKLVDESGFKVTAVCDYVGITRKTFYNKINGKSEFTATEIQKLCDKLNLTPKQRNDIFFAREVG